ncbi:SH3 domain-containing protein [Streptomyces sp. 549]|uniref:SH3 domain-containing protein n=1 Tax=Streptomyces sp. 549 TaxID=3049076 RepID=UPI0024C2722C|nr:SH3 domain-containing protein [Streptomyces sp. 549]MDK1475424.1 SH3 domain-containing protein [Streptomyces sp. 549]
MLKNRKIAAALASGALAAGLLAATPAIAMDEEPAEVQAAAAQTEVQEEAQTLAHPRYAYGKVVARSGVKIRAKATTASYALGGFNHGAHVKLACKVKGQWVHGNQIWYKLADRKGWVTARYVKNLKHVNYCR